MFWFRKSMALESANMRGRVIIHELRCFSEFYK